MADAPTIDQRRLNSFETRLGQIQADVTHLLRIQRDTRLQFELLVRRFDTLDSRMETVIEEMRRFFARYEHIDAERKGDQ